MVSRFLPALAQGCPNFPVLYSDPRQRIAGKANFEPATQSTRRKRPQIRAHPSSRRTDSAKRGLVHYPSASAQSAAMFGVALRKKRDDVSATQTLPDRLSVIISSPITQSGRWRGRPRIVARIDKKQFLRRVGLYPYKQHKGRKLVPADRTEALVYILAHELRHASATRVRSTLQLPRRARQERARD
jgi:hypothetical protein